MTHFTRPAVLVPWWALFGLASSAYLSGHPLIGCALTLAGAVTLCCVSADDEDDDDDDDDCTL
jgi:hypothetical protein